MTEIITIGGRAVLAGLPWEEIAQEQSGGARRGWRRRARELKTPYGVLIESSREAYAAATYVTKAERAQADIAGGAWVAAASMASPLCTGASSGDSVVAMAFFHRVEAGQAESDAQEGTMDRWWLVGVRNGQPIPEMDVVGTLGACMAAYNEVAGIMRFDVIAPEELAEHFSDERLDVSLDEVVQAVAPVRILPITSPAAQGTKFLAIACGAGLVGWWVYLNFINPAPVPQTIGESAEVVKKSPEEVAAYNQGALAQARTAALALRLARPSAGASVNACLRAYDRVLYGSSGRRVSGWNAATADCGPDLKLRFTFQRVDASRGDYDRLYADLGEGVSVGIGKTDATYETEAGAMDALSIAGFHHLTPDTFPGALKGQAELARRDGSRWLQARLVYTVDPSPLMGVDVTYEGIDEYGNPTPLADAAPIEEGTATFTGPSRNTLVDMISLLQRPEFGLDILTLSDTGNWTLQVKLVTSRPVDPSASADDAAPVSIEDSMK